MQLNSVCKVLVFTSTGEDWSLQGRPSGRADWYDGGEEEQGHRGTHENEPGTHDKRTEVVSVSHCLQPWWHGVLLEKLTRFVMELSTHPDLEPEKLKGDSGRGAGWSRSACDPTPTRWASQINSNMYALPWSSKHKNQWLLSPSKSPTISLVTPLTRKVTQYKSNTLSQVVSPTTTVFLFVSKESMLFQTLFANVHSTTLSKVTL